MRGVLISLRVEPILWDKNSQISSENHKYRWCRGGVIKNIRNLNLNSIPTRYLIVTARVSTPPFDDSTVTVPGLGWLSSWYLK